MEKSTSQKIVKVLGILSIIGAVLCLLGAVGMFGMGGIGAANAGETPDQDLAVGIASVFIVGILLLVSGIFELLQGIFSLRAAKDATKAQPLWVISIIALVFSVISLISSFGGESQSILSSVFSVVICAVVLYLANNIKKQGKGLL